MASSSQIDIESSATLYPLSPIQEGMLFHCIYARQPGVDISQIICDWQDKIDASVFSRAWQQVVERHAILRTSFTWEQSGSPRQRVQETLRFSVGQQDWSRLSRHEQDVRLEEFLRADRQMSFDSEVAPLMRVTLIRLAQAQYRFVWTVHHLLVDAHSFVIVLDDFFVIYQSLQSGQELPLKPAPRYREYIDWLQEQDWSDAESFWRRWLEGFTTPTSLPVSGRPNNGPLAGPSWAEEETVLTENLISALRELAKAHGLTLNTFLQGAWSVVLSRYSGEEDVVFGAVKSCRHLLISRPEEIAGPFINTLPVRVRCAADHGLIEWLKNLRDQWVALRPFEHSPLAKVQSWSQVPAGRPLFQTILSVLDPAWDAVLHAQGDKYSRTDFRIRNQPNFPLALDVYVASSARLKLVYDAGLFGRPAMKRMLGHLRTVLESMACAPQQRVADLPLLTEPERLQLLENWNQTEQNYPETDCVHRLFEAQVKRSPEALAVASRGVELSYAQLNEQANRVAHRLRALGVGPEMRVGICMERSVENVAGLLGILKTGGAYVPLDPEYPTERLAFMIADAKIGVLLTQRKWMTRLPAVDAQVICLDEMEAVPARADDLPGETTLKNLAYVIYTSGSTGTPKGVEIEHQGVVNLIRWHQERYQVRPEDRATQLANLSFDASVWEMWPYLTAGASIHIPDEEIRLNPAKLVQWLADHKITLTFLPTPLAEAIMDGAWPEGMALRALLTGGDRLHRPPRKKLPFQLVNHYGPTENSVVTTAAVIEPQGDVCEAPPVGRPIANTRAYVLDARLRPVPIGVPGELYVAGHGLARGYLDRPKLTAEKFITHPFSNGSFSRLYRTGDLVRYREDGNLEFLGRIDHQVKLRGCRIELGEIEAALSGHADVREAVVGAFEDGETRLAAYVVPEKKKSLTAAQLRDYLKQKLPEHMVPSGFVFLDALPLTPNGKVDRKGLPQPEFQQPDKNFVAPRTRVERLLADIWCELLRLQRVGVHDNFFALGGHSLLATQLVSRVRSVFGVELPLQTVFEQPTLDQFAARLKEARRDQGRARPLARSSANNKHGEVELSFAQERLWFLEQLEPGLAVYNVPIAIALEGNLDIPALKRSLNELVARHGIFRTSFKSAQEHPKAQRAETLNIELPVIALPSEERLEALMATEAAQPFDLTQAPLIRAKLVRLGSRKHLLLLTTHHIASDGWSMAIFYQELRELYEGHTQGKEASLPELSLEYDDYARWQRDSLQGELLEEQLAFWKRQLQEPLAALDLPLNHPRPAQQSHRGKAEYFALSNSLCADLKTLCRQEDVTLFMLLFATYQALLHRYSGQDDIVTGTTVAGRTRSEIEGLAGLFLNTLALRTDMSGEVTFRGLLQQVRKVALEAYAHQDAPFEKVVEALGVERDLSRSPVFQTMFVLQKAPLPSTRAGDLEWRSVPVHSGTSKFDLTLSLQEEAGGLSGYVEYDCDLFESDTVLRMLGHFQTLLQAVVVNPDQKLWELPLLTTAERQQVLVEWNGTAPANSSKDLCLHQLIEEQAARTPDHAAIVWQQQTLTYHELNRRANQLARRLRAMGVGPDVLVALFLDRSPEMLVGIMGILKAGGAYVPLDPDHPKKRLASILEDSKPLLVLTQQSLVNELPSFAGQSICLDADWAEIAGQSENLVSHVKPEHLAYVLFTSGSTGRPKGVALEHRSAVNFVQWAKQIFTPQELAGVLFSTSICFDLSVFEIFVTLSAGGTIILAPNALQLPTLSEKDQVTLVNTVPSVIAELLRMDALPASVRTVNLAGEALSDRLVEQLYATANVEKVYNLYGPTETTTYSTYTLVRRGCPVTIGRPIADTQCYILDASRNPVPIGVTGELYISGTGLARGYYGRPELTAERFVPDQERGERMYRTGDLCRWTPDGNIQYLGRADHQVKLRGLRIELGEIEHALADDQGVKDAVVKIWEDRDGDKWLVAYYIPSAMPLTAGYLRDILQAKLPDYMVPSHFVAMEAFPLTPNGKLNRKALPAPEVTACARGYEAPLGEIESTLAQIWCDVLKVERVGRHDHFFDLGGHSLLTIKTVSRIRDVFEMDIPTRTLFEKPTLADLAKILTGAKGSGGNVQRIEPRTQSGLCALSFAQERFWLLHQLAPASPVYNIVDVIRFEGTYEAAMRRALKELVRRHEILRTAFADSDEQPMQIVLPTSDLVLSELDLSALPAQEREREWIHMVRDEGRKPFDLSQAPLLRGTVVHLSPQEHRLLLTLHHIIADEWSMEVLHQEVNELYAAFSQGQPSALPELPIQYADFAIWQRDWLQGGVLQGQLAYWKDTLAGAPSLLELPTDKPRPAVQSLRGATETFALPKDLLERLKALGRQHQATLFMTLEASFAALLHRYTGQEDILVGTPISGRRHSETERLIGCFLNTVVLRTQFTDDLTFRSLLRQVRERALGAYAHQDLPFDHLVAELAPQRDPSRTPLVQVMFTLFNTGGVSQTSKVSGIRELETGTSKFDLTLSISETEDGLEGVVEYSTDLFDAQTIRRLYGHYGTLLEEIARDPEQRISKLPMLTASERHQILNEWNNMARNYPKDECVHHLFEKMAKQATNRTAVECGGRSLTYGQLNAQASRLADYLRDLGVGPGVIAGIYVERSLEMVIALLAILKTGGTYLPLDAAYPVERLAYMIEDSRALLVLTQKSLAAHLQEVGVTRVLLDDPLPDTDTTAHQTADPEKAAYVIYTSGSTGKPKGVAVPHRGVVNFLTSMAREPGLSNTDVLVAVTTLSFDIAVLELLLPLTVGAKLVVASHDAIADGDALRSVLERHGATAMQATPITWRLLIEADWHPPSTFKALVGGEPLPKDLADELIARGVELWNMYGPTETTVWSTCARIVDTTKGITIGKPIANTTVRILDERKNLCPIGIPGELCIGGGGVALGYWNRPELTAERFISDPFDAKSGARLYRTGDRARWRNDGTLEHLGRLDFQVKLRGFRIELGEIETGIAQHPAVREVAVLVREDTPADKRLVAYLVSDNAPAGLIEKVRARLRAAMPEYMVPSQFVMLDALPRTHNGKLDRKALPAPAATDGSLLHREAVAPRTPTEEMVLDVFQDVLDRTDFGVSDNFFDLGGHSLMAARLMSKLRAVSGTDLPLRDLFARPTAAALAEAIDALQWLHKSNVPRDYVGVREEIVL